MNEMENKTATPDGGRGAKRSVPSMPEALAVGETPAAAESSGQEKGATDHPIAKAVSNFVYKLQDFEGCAVRFVVAAAKLQLDSLKKVRAEGLELEKELEKASREKIPDAGSQVRLVGRTLEFSRRLQPLLHARPDLILRESLFIGMFGALDAFSADLLRALFERKPALFGALNRQVDVAAIMESKTLEDLKRSLVEDEIEAFHRESYDRQFSKLETLFGLKLRSFPRWGEFIERSQRRNLLTHCDGRVTDQYLEACRSAGVSCDKGIGARVDVSLEDLKATAVLLMEIGIKLAHTLWRKVLPEELKQADETGTCGHPQSCLSLASLEPNQSLQRFRDALFFRRLRRTRGEFLEARIIPKRIKHRIEPEQRRGERHVLCSQQATGRCRE
jgi:hypothetical protein